MYINLSEKQKNPVTLGLYIYFHPLMDINMNQ